jgi:transposase
LELWLPSARSVREAAMRPGLAIREDVATAAELRRLARQEPKRRTALRLLAIANAMDGMSRAAAARAVGLERQALRDAVVRFNTEGLAGLVDRPHGRRPERLTEGEQAVLVDRILRRPDADRGELVEWTLRDLVGFIEARFGRTLTLGAMSRLLRRLGLSKQKTRPTHPQKNVKAVAAFAKGGSPAP